MLFLFSLCAPLLGTFFTPFVALFMVSIALLCKQGISMYSITLGIPTIIATICWLIERQPTRLGSSIKILLNVVLPLACIVAFAVHPVGGDAFTYALYWLIPPVLFIFKNQNTYIKLINSALRITFITHAIGSILWLYMVPSTSTMWLALIPIVAVERLCFAGASFAMIEAIKLASKRIGKTAKA